MSNCFGEVLSYLTGLPIEKFRHLDANLHSSAIAQWNIAFEILDANGYNILQINSLKGTMSHLSCSARYALHVETLSGTGHYIACEGDSIVFDPLDDSPPKPEPRIYAAGAAIFVWKKARQRKCTTHKCEKNTNSTGE